MDIDGWRKHIYLQIRQLRSRACPNSAFVGLASVVLQESFSFYLSVQCLVLDTTYHNMIEEKKRREVLVTALPPTLHLPLQLAEDMARVGQNMGFIPVIMGA